MFGFAPANIRARCKNAGLTEPKRILYRRPRRMGTKLTQERAKRGAESQSDNMKRECLSGDVFVEITRSLYSLKMAVNTIVL
jgi:hypothetical protein